MTFSSPSSYPARRTGVGRLIAVVLLIWLIIGAVAAGQRHYFSSKHTNCASAATITVTVLAGPLNYLGVNPKIKCTVPQPTK
jgi:membrane protein YdbS with pleckstrin-like domain